MFRGWWSRANDRYQRVSVTVIWQLLGRQKRWLVALFVLAIFEFLVAVLVAVEIQQAVDLAIIEQTDRLQTYTDALVGLAFLGLLVGIPFRQVVARLGYHLEFQLRLWVYERLQNMHPTVLDALASGQAVTRAMSDLTMLELLTLLVPTLAVGIVLLTALAVVLLVEDPLLGSIALLSMPLNLWLVMRIRKPLFGMSWTILNRRAEVTTAIDEAVRGARVVKAFAREDDERAKVAESAAGAYSAALNRVRLTARYDLLLRVAPILVDALLIVLGARRVVEGRFSIGQLLIFLIFSGVFTGLARAFDEIVSIWQLARSGARRIFELIDMAPSAPPAPPRPVPGDQLVVQGEGFELEVTPGELVVLDGILPPGGLRGPGVLVLDDHPFLFGRSLGDNLRMADPGATDERLLAALAAAGATDVAEGLGGLDGAVGDRGLTLSGGQRQRVALARALVAPPAVLVLHDALAAVNPSLELEILGRARTFAPDMAIVAVASRPLVAATADRRVGTGLAPVADRPAGVDLLAALAVARPEDLLPPELIEALASVPPEHDRPSCDEATASASDHAPTVFNVLRPFGRTALAAAVLLLGATVLGLVPPGLLQLAIDDVRNRATGTADRVAAGIILCGVLIGVLTYAYKILAAKVSEGIMYLLRRRTFQRLTRLGVDFYDRELPGQVAARVVHDLDRIAAFVDTGVYQAGTAAILLLTTLAVMFVWNAEVGLVVLAFIPFFAVVTIVEVPLANRAYERARARLGVVIAHLQEDLAGRYVIAAFSARPVARAHFAEAAGELRAARRRSTTISNIHGELVAFFVALATAAVLASAGRLAIAGALSVGSAVALELYLVLAFDPIPQLSTVLQSYLAARASFRTLGEPFEAPIVPAPAGEHEPAPTVCPPLDGALAFEGVTFAYPGTDREVIGDVDLAIPAGSLVAVVGPTGAGKSTLAKLLGRVYDPTAGRVTVDGVDVRVHESVSYRRRLGVVPQDGFCFRGTLAANIGYGRPDATRAELDAAMRTVGAGRVVDALPGGLDGYVDEEGRNLSAPHRQLVALARAWLVDPDVLVLDEATSALEPDEEAHLLDAVAATDRTTVFVTHRRSVAERADLVVVVQGGRVVATGAHAHLLEEHWYAGLWPDAAPDEATVSGGAR